MICETVPEVVNNTSNERRIYIESQEQHDYLVPRYTDKQSIDGVLYKDKDSLIYSYVTEDQIDVSEIEDLSI